MKSDSGREKLVIKVIKVSIEKHWKLSHRRLVYRMDCAPTSRHLYLEYSQHVMTKMSFEI